MFRARNIPFEVAERTQAICYGGIGLMHSLARECGLIEAIDRNVELLKVHFPYHESDHVLNIAYNALTDGRCLEDIEHKRNDEAYLDALGAKRPESKWKGADPTNRRGFLPTVQNRRADRSVAEGNQRSAANRVGETAGRVLRTGDRR